MSLELPASAPVVSSSASSNAPDHSVSHSPHSKSLEQDMRGLQIEDEVETTVKRAARSISAAHAIVIVTSNGMGIDCPLPDLRGKQGFWNTFPGLKALGRSFTNDGFDY